MNAPAPARDAGRRHGVELLALTKLNWNHSRLNGHDPITTHAARNIGGILRHVEPEGPIGNRYAVYMQVARATDDSSVMLSGVGTYGPGQVSYNVMLPRLSGVRREVRPPATTRDARGRDGTGEDG